MTTKSQEAFEEALKNKPEAKMWNAHDLMFWAWNRGEAYGRNQALEDAIAIVEKEFRESPHDTGVGEINDKLKKLIK